MRGAMSVSLRNDMADHKCYNPLWGAGIGVVHRMRRRHSTHILPVGYRPFRFLQKVEQSVTDILAYLGSSFSLETYTNYVAEKCGKPIFFEEYPLAIGDFGLCFELIDAYVILLPPNLDIVSKSLYLMTCLHELAHILLKHTRTSHITYAVYCKNRLVLKNSLHRLVKLPTEKKDNMAEIHGSFLLGSLLNHELSTPARIKEIYGYNE